MSRWDKLFESIEKVQARNRADYEFVARDQGITIKEAEAQLTAPDPGCDIVVAPEGICPVCEEAEINDGATTCDACFEQARAYRELYGY